ncbi:hypothetical protein [uncultured Polaribacter sp.]|uniref:hypothetical protein n=1 Tax=uncultured Polaribacter sp. TaxID=174711 RepID=UPI00262188EA|nr:hypothetical protein [uncultured Polaribacter sp.]
MMKLKLVSIFIFLSFQTLTSQEKFEKEYRVNSELVPKQALQILETWNFPKKVKWYAEESNIGKTFEAKTRFKKHKYSIEFNAKGEILDVEKTVKLKQLSLETKKVLKKALQSSFKKYKINKIQIQYSGTATAIYNKIFQVKTEQAAPILKYEIVVKGKKESKQQLFEVLINQNGEIEQEQKIRTGLTLNLEF